MNIFNPSRNYLISRFESLQHDYKQAQSHPHLIIDNLFAPEILERIATEGQTNRDRQSSIGQSSVALQQKLLKVPALPSFARTFYFWLNSFDFIAPLTLVLDRPKKSLIGDPTYHRAGLYNFTSNTQLELDSVAIHPHLPLACQYHLIICLDSIEKNNAIDIGTGENKSSYQMQFNRTFVLPMTKQSQYRIGDRSKDRHNSKFLSIYYWQQRALL